MAEVSAILRIQNLKGLHARATSAFVKTADSFQSDITVQNADGVAVSGKSIMGLLMLAVPLGADITVTANGPDAEAALDALTMLVNNRFGEE